MLSNHHLILIQQKILPTLNIILLRCIKTILKTWKLSASVFLSCKSLVYFWIYLSFSLGRLLCQMYSAQIQKITGDLVNRLIQYSFPIHKRRIQIQHILDNVMDRLSLALQQSSIDNSDQEKCTIDVIEQFLPLGTLLRAVKSQKNRQMKIDMWINVVVNSWTQVMLFPYIMANLVIVMSLEEWHDLEILEAKELEYNEKLEINAPAILEKIDRDSCLGQRVKKGIEEFVKPMSSIVRHCLYQYGDKAKCNLTCEELNFQDVDDAHMDKVKLEEILNVHVGRDDLHVLIRNIRFSLEKYMPCFHEEYLFSRRDQSQDMLPLIRTESCTTLRTYMIDKIFDSECIPFLDLCFFESPSYTEPDGQAKLLHLCVNISARLHKVVNKWLKHDQAMEDFLLNIQAM